MGFSKTEPLGSRATTRKRCRDILFKEDNIKYITQTHRSLILSVRLQALKVVVIAAHAPHSGQNIEDIQSWWTQLTSAIPAKYADWPRLFLGDANAEVGDRLNRFIGDHQPGVWNPKSEPFSTFVVEQGIFLPSAFKSCHEGDRTTWLHPKGSTSRIDYVGLPVSWSLTSCATSVDADVDACAN